MRVPAADTTSGHALIVAGNKQAANAGREVVLALRPSIKDGGYCRCTVHAEEGGGSCDMRALLWTLHTG